MSQEPKPAVWYVYGLTASGLALPAGLTGVGGEGAPVGLLPVGHLQAVVSPSDELGPEPSAANVMAHQQVLAAVMQAGTVIPFAFGTVLPEAMVTKLVRAAQSECLDLLQHLAGKMEVGLKLFWQKETFLADIETREITDWRRRLEQAAPARRAALEPHLGELLEQAADQRRSHYQQLIYAPLAARAAAARLADTIGPRMILNASFLIGRAAEAEFDALVNQVCQPFLDQLEVRYSGPWPPYNFVTLRLRAEEGG